MLASARLPVTRPRCVSLAVLLWLPGIILLVPKEELAGVSLQVLILGPLSVSALWVRKHPDTKCRDGWRASVLYLDSLGYCCRFCAKQIKDYKQPGRVVLKRPWKGFKHDLNGRKRFLPVIDIGPALNAKTVLAIKIRQSYVNSLAPDDMIWYHGNRTTLCQVMACCLPAPSHYQNQCWFIVGGVSRP